MKKEKVSLNKIREIFIDIEAIASTSSFERKIDSKLETLARCIKNAIPVDVSDKLDDIKAKRRKLIDKYRKEVLGKPKMETEFQRLLMSDNYLADAKSEEDELWKTEIDFSFNPVHITDDQIDSAYDNLPSEETLTSDAGDIVIYSGEQVEYKGDIYTVKRLRKKLRQLINDGYIIIGEEPSEAAVKPLNKRKS